MLQSDRGEHQHRDQNERGARGQQNDLPIGDHERNGHRAANQHDNDEHGNENATAMAAVVFVCGITAIIWL